MENVSLSDVFHLPVEERIRLVQAIWDSLAEHPEQIHLTEAQRAELDRCYAEYLKNPDEGSPWPEVKARLLAGE
jgi:putative addiction module component (TIGR02574 family)